MLTVLRYPMQTPIRSACRVATGRSAVFHMISRYSPGIVYMPSYVPEGIIKPFELAGVAICFYKLDGWLCPNFDDLAKCMEHGKAKERPVIVLIHYFGNGVSTLYAERLAKEHGGIVLSDRAHCVPFANSFHEADVTLYSLNKFLPVVDGAIMYSRRDDVDISADNELLLPDAALAAYEQHLEVNRRLSGTPPTDEDLVRQFSEESSETYERYYSFIERDFSLRSQSAMSRAVEAATNFTDMQRLRRAKSDILLERIISEHMAAYDQSCQFAFPIRCRGKKAEIAAAMFSAGIIPSQLIDKWDHIPRDQGFDAELAFLDDHLLLPIHEGVELHDLLKMADVLSHFRGA